MTTSRFGLISDIDPERPETWEESVFLTLDIDWAHDTVIRDAIDLIEGFDVPATWFITHDTPMVARLRSNPRFELGIHPNFNWLLDGDPRNGANAEEVVDRLLLLVPEARSVRSHAMTQSSNLISMFRKKGLTHDANHFIPEQSGIELKPWRHWGDVVKVPYFWEDDVHCLSAQNSSIGELVARPGLRVFDFHPIHIFLNTEDMARYEDARGCFADPGQLTERRNTEGLGARNLLVELLAAVKRGGGDDV
jgi:hypothetical protein